LATEEIGKILGGVKGIVEQANTDGIGGRQLDLLEREANDLVVAIKELAKSTHANGVNPLAGDKIKLEVEEKLGKTLEFILPDDAADSFGLQNISFSSKDLIIATITKVSVAQQQFEQLRRSVDQTGIEIKKTVAELESLFRNGEASEAIVADVDQALHLAEKTKKGISARPDVAMGSIGGVNRRSVSVLD
jgi:flagellin-like hook-associated protein FlgL